MKKILIDNAEALYVLKQEQMRRTQYVWKTKDGTEIPVQSMSDSHLQNTIRMLERNKDLQEQAAEYAAYMWDLD